MATGSRPMPPGAVIVHVVREPEISGSQRVAFDILADRALAGFRRVMVCGSRSRASARFLAEADRLGVEVRHVESLRRDVGTGDWRLFRELLAVMRELKPALVHTHSGKPFLLGGIAARMAGVPLRVHTLHGISFHEHTPAAKRPIFYLIEQFGSTFYDAVVSVNRQYERYFPLARRRRAFTVITNGVALPAVALPRPAAHRAGEFPVLFVGRLDEQKNPLFVLEIAKEIGSHWQSGPMPRFYVAGDGPLAAHMAAEIERSELGERVVLLGWVTDLPTHYAEAKALLMTSRWEACPLVLIEAAAYGCPAVAAAIDGVSELIAGDENGLLFSPGDVAGACRQLARLGGDPAFHGVIADHARRRAHGRDVATMQAQYMELYRHLGLDLP